MLERPHFDADEGGMSPQSFNETAENKKLCGIFSLNKSPKATPRLRIFHWEVERITLQWSFLIYLQVMINIAREHSLQRVNSSKKKLSSFCELLFCFILTWI